MSCTCDSSMHCPGCWRTCLALLPTADLEIACLAGTASNEFGLGGLLGAADISAYSDDHGNASVGTDEELGIALDGDPPDCGTSAYELETLLAHLPSPFAFQRLGWSHTADAWVELCSSSMCKSLDSLRCFQNRAGNG